MKLEESYARLLGRQPSEDERRNLYRVRDALDLRDNDALFVVLMALQHYQTLYESIPNQIAKASEEAVRRPNRLTYRALAIITAAVLYTFAYAIQSRESGYADGYTAGYKSADESAHAETRVATVQRPATAAVLPTPSKSPRTSEYRGNLLKSPQEPQGRAVGR